MRSIVWAALMIGLVASGCARDVIPNTDVEDTPENRDVVEFCEGYRAAVTARSVERLMALAHPDYFDDLGTPQGDDDVDLAGLKAKLESTFGPDLLSVHYDIRYRDVIFAPTKVFVDYTYIGRFQVTTPEGPRWERRLADNRLVLAKQGEGKFAILSGM